MQRTAATALPGIWILTLVSLLVMGGGMACDPDREDPVASPTIVAETPVSLPGDFTIRAYTGADRLGGETVLLSSVVGHGQPVVLNFWGGLCPPCRGDAGFPGGVRQLRRPGPVSWR